MTAVVSAAELTIALVLFPAVRYLRLVLRSTFRYKGSWWRPRLLYSRSKRAILARHPGRNALKKKTSSDSGSSTTPRRRRRHAVQYLLIFVGCVLVVDALVGDK